MTVDDGTSLIGSKWTQKNRAMEIIATIGNLGKKFNFALFLIENWNITTDYY